MAQDKPKFSPIQKLKIRHYIRHGMKQCVACRAGFDAYWLNRPKRTI